MNILRPITCANLVRNSFKYSRNFYPIASNFLCEKPYRIQQANMYSSAILDAKTNGIFGKIFGNFKNSKTRIRGSSVLLYENVADNINYVEFFQEFNLPDTFNSWFLVTELHCWLILTRAMQEGSEADQDGRFLRNCIVEIMWKDVQARAKKLSMANPSASRAQIGILAEQFQATLINYDEGLMSDDMILASALWRRFFSMKCDDYSKIEKLVKYVRKTALQLENMTREQLLSDTKIAWSSINE